jgi:hydroxymethylbilane synthase
MALEPPAAVRIGTRGSALALRQTALVTEWLRAEYPGLDVSVVVIKTLGDQVTAVPLTQMGDVGIFTSSLERALNEDRIDLAVHSIKDLPTAGSARFMLGATLERGNPADVLISREGYKLATLPQGATIGTCSHRRAAQLRRLRPDLVIRDLRGNIDTRLEKALAPDSPYDAIILAYAGLERLGRLDAVSEVLPLEAMLPAPGQAALGVQCRAAPGEPWLHLLKPLNHLPSQLAVEAERALLAALEGGCSLPIGAYGRAQGEKLHLRGCILSLDGDQQLEAEGSYPLGLNPLDSAREAGKQLAAQLQANGAGLLSESGHD